ncbi:MAG: hypothetical protein ACLQVW_32520 [Limisphaerales bacterium]
MNNGSTVLQRWVPLLAWLMVGAACAGIFSKTLGYGYIPPGDARRYVAKAVTDKEYGEILVLGPTYQMNFSPGWEWLLLRLHRSTGWGEDGLIVFSAGGLLLLILVAGLPWLRYPEAWLAALLAVCVPLPGLMPRWLQGRPFLISEAALLWLLLAWRRDSDKKPSWGKILGSMAAFALAAWMHGTWYLYGLLLGSFFLAQRWRATICLTACWVGGTILGALLTGHPWEFLRQNLVWAGALTRGGAPTQSLVGELQPSSGEFSALLVLGFVWLWRKQQSKQGEDLFRSPLFWMMALCWVLALKAGRFWADWGLAAAMAWLAAQFDAGIDELWAGNPARRLAVCGVVCLALFLDTTSDIDSRYTGTLREPVVDGSQPEMQGWMPDKGGVFYGADFSFFFNTFYKNPRGDWRYILGYESAIMPDADLKIYRDIQWNHYAWEAYQPWVDKMRPQDRLEITSPTEPVLPPLQWHRAAGAIWIGRLPRR